jgi:predicted nucleic acid-binding protein
MLWDQQLGKLSYQVLNEYYVTVTTKLDRRLPLQQAREDVQDLLTWDPIQLTDIGLADAWTLQDRFGFSWWDTLILAAARASACTFLLTEDLQHGQLIDELKIISPFEADPELLLTAQS